VDDLSPLGERHAIIRRLFTRAAEREGSLAHLAQKLGIPFSELREYLRGETLPSEKVLLSAVQIILDELPAIRSQFSRSAWQALSLPLQ
jgi:transcriptional regulator with XRE-family HTH domain